MPGPITAYERDRILAALIAASAPWDPAAVFVGVFTAIVDNGINTFTSNITPATGAMGTRQAITTWSAPHIKTDGRAMVDSPIRRFTPASSTESQSLLGWAIYDALTAGNLLAYGYFPNPIPMPDATTSVAIIVRLDVPPSGQLWTDVVALNG